MTRYSTEKLLARLEELDGELLDDYNSIIGHYNDIAIRHNQYRLTRKQGKLFSVTERDIQVLRKIRAICLQYNAVLSTAIRHISAHETEAFKNNPFYTGMKREYIEHRKMLNKITKIKIDVAKFLNRKREVHVQAQKKQRLADGFFKSIREKQNQLASDYEAALPAYNKIVDKYNQYIISVTEDNSKSTVYPLTEFEMGVLESMRSTCRGYLKISTACFKAIARNGIGHPEMDRIRSDARECHRILATIETGIYNWGNLHLNKQFLPQFTQAKLEVKTSLIPHAGQGLFVASGNIDAGDIIGSYPGIPVPESSNRYNKKSHYLFGFQLGEDRIENGFMIDGDPKHLNKISKDMGIEPPLGSETPVHMANMALGIEDCMGSFRPVFLPSGMSCSSMPFGNARSYVLPKVVAIADTNIRQGEEILMDYGHDSRETFKKRCGQG